MSLDTFLHLVDRVGAPMGILVALVYVRRRELARGQLARLHGQ
jgi:hypothetical protein